MRRIASALTAVTLSLVIACAPGAAPDTAADEAAIRAIDTNWNAWLTAQNDSAIGAIYSADAILLPPNMPRITGSAAIRAFWAQLWALKAELVLTPVSIRVSGASAVEEGNWTFSATPPTGPQKDNGKYLVVWHKDAGAWHAVQDIWNSDNPPPPTAAAPATTK